MKYIIVALMTLTMTACNEADVPNLTNNDPNPIPQKVLKDSTSAYDFEITGEPNMRFAATFSTDNLKGHHDELDTGIVTLQDANPVTYTVSGFDVIANVTLISGAGILTIVFKKDGSPIQTQTITTNATDISMSDGT